MLNGSTSSTNFTFILVISVYIQSFSLFQKGFGCNCLGTKKSAEMEKALVFRTAAIFKLSSSFFIQTCIKIFNSSKLNLAGMVTWRQNKINHFEADHLILSIFIQMLCFTNVYLCLTRNSKKYIGGSFRFKTQQIGQKLVLKLIDYNFQFRSTPTANFCEALEE